jgi:hypothetical protein
MSAADCRTRATELIQTATKIAKVSCTFVPEDRFPSLREVLIYHSQVRDLVILDVQAPLPDLRQGLVEAILFGSGRPIILVPSTARPLAGERAVVVWHATRSPVRALHDALPLLVRGREVVIVSVTDDEEFQADHSGEHVCHHLGRQHIDSRLSPSSGGLRRSVTFSSTTQRELEPLLVMGGFGHPREREFLFGSATRDIFESNQQIAVLLSPRRRH